MKKFMDYMENHFIPVAAKIGNQRHLLAIRDAFLATMPLMILGALAVMLNNLPIPGFTNLMNTIFHGTGWMGFGTSVWNGTFGILSVFIAFMVAYNLAKSYKSDPIASGVVSLAAFFTLGAVTSGLNSSGLFVAIITGIIAAELMRRLLGNKHLLIKMPDGVPPAVAKAFASLLPAMITVSLFGIFAAIIMALGIKDMFAAFYKLVQEPFMGLANSYGSALLISFIAPFLWFFGLHGANMIDPFMQTINAPAIAANVHAIAAGKAAPFVVSKPFFDSFVNMGGTGVTIGLLIAIYLVGRKNKPYMIVSNLAMGPGIFNINEPLLFGLPIVLNPILLIPFILAPMVCVSIAYFATIIGFVPACTVMPPWVTPPVIGAIIATKSISGGIIAALNIVIATLIYMPFVQVATRMELKKQKNK